MRGGVVACPRRELPTSDNALITSTTTSVVKKLKPPRDHLLDHKPDNGDLILVPPTSTHHRSRRVTPTSADDDVSEKLLSNGDLYIGTFSGSIPHGRGKYLWADGCMYEGELKRGKASGRGKFSWPSGATYEGEFRSGRMDGAGTYIGADGCTYRGAWAADLKHGFGEKRYRNGDVYVGYWKSNAQDGEGRYIWSNGNAYVGEWKNGVMSGKGVLIWADGKRFEGNWKNGMPEGNGNFTWPDGLSNPKPCLGVPAARKRWSVDGGKIGSGEKNGNFPRICIWELNGEAGDITCDIIDNVDASMFYRDGGVALLRRSPPCVDGPEVKKPGEMISKGHKNYELMLNFQLGIRYSTGKYGSIKRQITASDFDPKEKFWTRFPPEGSKGTPPHSSIEFKWKDYCPMVFRDLRELFEIDTADYMLAICGNDALREMSSPGKSGSFFYLTQDDRFMIKTLKKSEIKVLIRMLPTYYEHVCQHRNSLITKFFGVHSVKLAGGQKTRFIVMGNVFHSQYRIHKRFDLKGSSYGRTTDKPEGEIDETITLKDLDLNFVFHLQRSKFEEVIRQIERDCEFLEAEKIMDYSFLIGVHFCNNYLSDEMSTLRSHTHTGQIDAHQEGKGRPGYQSLKADSWDTASFLEGWKPRTGLGANLPARAVHQTSRVEADQVAVTGNGMFDVILYFGIIDILQDYDISKRLEHAYKSLQVDATSISAVDPKLYSKRFRDFIHKVFLEESP